MGDPNRQPLTLEADANISVDVDSLNCYRAIHGLPAATASGPDPVWTLGVTRALALFEEVGLEATFFLVGRDLQEPAQADIARRIVGEGHEAANHTLDHFYNLRRMSEVEIFHQIRRCDLVIEETTGVRPVGFRTPGYNLSPATIALSRRAGHRYDASVFPCSSYWAAKAVVMALRRLGDNKSRSDRTDPRTLLAPREPYHPDPRSPWRRARGPVSYVEIPVSVWAAGALPLIGTSLHLLDGVGWERIWPWIHRRFPRFFSLEFHALDFIDGSDLKGVDDGEELVRRQPDLRISVKDKTRRYRRVLSSIVRDRQAATLAASTAFLIPSAAADP